MKAEEIVICPQCHKKCEIQYGIIYCKDKECSWGEAPPSAVSRAQQATQAVLERVSVIEKKIPPGFGQPLYEEYLSQYRSYMLTVDFLKLLDPKRQNESRSHYYENFLQLYREHEVLCCTLDKIEKELEEQQ